MILAIALLAMQPPIHPQAVADGTALASDPRCEPLMQELVAAWQRHSSTVAADRSSLETLMSAMTERAAAAHRGATSAGQQVMSIIDGLPGAGLIGGAVNVLNHAQQAERQREMNKSTEEVENATRELMQNQAARHADLEPILQRMQAQGC